MEIYLKLFGAGGYQTIFSSLVIDLHHYPEVQKKFFLVRCDAVRPSKSPLEKDDP
jgi:hypothetical protein